jgi:hypothetical protein
LQLPAQAQHPIALILPHFHREVKGGLCITHGRKCARIEGMDNEERKKYLQWFYDGWEFGDYSNSWLDKTIQ